MQSLRLWLFHHGFINYPLSPREMVVMLEDQVLENVQKLHKLEQDVETLRHVQIVVNDSKDPIVEPPKQEQKRSRRKHKTQKK